MKDETFVDTSGFYALLVKADDRHEAATRVLRDAATRGRRFVTTDYVLDETATLLKARGLGHLLGPFFESVLRSKGCRVEWMDRERFLRAKDFLLKQADKPWSFTDAASFCIMKEVGVKEALTKDDHFRMAGFAVLLA